MQIIPIYQADAFTTTLFRGNPAAICLLDKWLDDKILQSIAAENNLAETAFLVPDGIRYCIRWFTPVVEVDLCGHATLAAAHVLFEILHYPEKEITFFSPRSGELSVTREANLLFLNFPTDSLTTASYSKEIEAATGIRPLSTWKGKTDIIAVFENETQIKFLAPDLKQIAALPCRGVIMTAPGQDVDFVSRFFAPQSGIDEDPVTGSAHTSLTPLWSKQLGKTALSAQQLSPRGGSLTCMLKNDRCIIGGSVQLYSSGNIYLHI